METDRGDGDANRSLKRFLLLGLLGLFVTRNNLGCLQTTAESGSIAEEMAEGLVEIPEHVDLKTRLLNVFPDAQFSRLTFLVFLTASRASRSSCVGSRSSGLRNTDTRGNWQSDQP